MCVINPKQEKVESLQRGTDKSGNGVQNEHTTLSQRDQGRHCEDKYFSYV